MRNDSYNNTLTGDRSNSSVIKKLNFNGIVKIPSQQNLIVNDLNSRNNTINQIDHINFAT